MVNTLLEVYRFEAGRKTLAFQPVNLRSLLEEVAGELRPLAEAKALAIKLDLTEELTSKIIGDRLELHRLFTNLVGNAIKFTDTGSITIRLTSQAQIVTIEVADTGSGIPSEEQATLFERFRQGSHKSSGSGLGLYLSRRIVEAHQGTIQVNSEFGKGSVFIVNLPVEQ
jgi:signal transduction histidine kinase